MVDVSFIIGILVMVGIAVLIFKFLENLSHAILFLNIAVFIILAVAGIIAFNDVKTFTESFHEKEKVVLVEKDGQLIGALLWKGNITRELDKAKYSEAFQSSNYKKIIGEGQIVIVAMEGVLGANYSKLQSYDSIKAVFAEYKNGNMTFYPEPLFFRAAKIVPLKVFEDPEKSSGFLGSQKSKIFEESKETGK